MRYSSPRMTVTYFNPRPREGGDVGQLGLVRFKGISIHAPARGATRGRRS